MNLKKLVKKEMMILPPEIEKRNDAVEVQITTKFKDDHFHFIMNDNNEIVREVIEAEAAEIGFNPYNSTSQKEPPKEIVFHNRQAIGDILTFTAGVRDFKNSFPNTRVGVISTASHIWDHNPHIDHSFRDEKHILKVGPGFLTNKSNRWNYHMCNAFRLDIQNKLGVKIEQGVIRPDIWMTEEEYKRPPILDGPYWIFIYGGEPGWPVKQYHRWQEVITILVNKGIKVVQLGVEKHPYPVLDGVVNYIGKTQDGHTGIRDLFNIFLHSQGSLGLVSMHMHLSAAFGNPCVVVNGAREPAWFTNYFGHQYIQTNGTLSCGEQTSCWKCAMKGCKQLVSSDHITKNHISTKVPKCIEIIEPEEIAEGVMKYYKGGRLEYGKKIPNKFFKNIVKEARIFIAPKPDQIDEELLSQYGFQWGSGAITDRDWMFMKDIIKDDKIKTILEFGAGLSTLLFGSVVDKVETHETAKGWVDKIKPMANPDKHSFYMWDGKTISNKESRYDMVFVDGPAGGENREWSVKYASELADIVIVHDAGRVPEREWQTKYLEKDFKLVAKGGHRCHYWKRKHIIKPVEYKVVDNGRPLARMITTARGYGGSERSSIEIMKMLQDRNYNVQLCPTNNVSWEYKANIPEGVQVLTEWNHVITSCDLAVFYCSDTIWNYHKDHYMGVMPYIDAKRKVMVVNYKVGGVGKVDWTKGWDKYLFLSSLLEEEVVKRMPGIETKIMAPPTSLDLFFKNEIDYSFPLRLIRHNSQGDNKHHVDTDNMMNNIISLVPGVEFHSMPGFSRCMQHPQVFNYEKNKPFVWDFLKRGNCFFYRLPDGYTEGGPKVIMEAMASGLPVIADNHSGPKDRVTPETGWLCNSWSDYIKAIMDIVRNPELLRIKGEAAREYAKEHFIAERWIEEILE